MNHFARTVLTSLKIFMGLTLFLTLYYPESIFVTCACAILLTVAFYHWYKRTVFNAFESSKVMCGISLFNLVKQDAPKWMDGKGIHKYQVGLETLNYIFINNFTIKEMPGVTLMAMLNRQHNSYAVLYDSLLGTHIDLVSYYEDNTETTYTSNGVTLFDTPSHMTTVYAPKSNLKKLHTRFLNERDEKPLKCVNAVGFSKQIEASTNAYHTYSETQFQKQFEQNEAVA